MLPRGPFQPLPSVTRQHCARRQTPSAPSPQLSRHGVQTAGCRQGCNWSGHHGEFSTTANDRDAAAALAGPSAPDPDASDTQAGPGG